MKIKLTLLFIFFGATMFLSLHSGSVNLGWSEIIDFLLGRASGDSSLILSQLRGPRVLAGAMVGASLGGVGLVFQTLLRNPLAEPYTLGLSGGSALGAVLALNLNLTPSLFWIPSLSSIGGLLATLLVLLLAHRQLEFESRSLILFGIMISLFFGAIVVTGMSILSPDKLQAALFWLLGEFGTTRDLWIFSLGPILFGGLIFLLSKANALDSMALGEARALSLGFSPQRERVLLIVVCTLITAIGVSIAGLIGFIGLVSSHMARRILHTSRHLGLLVGASLIGGTLLMAADAVGRTVAGSAEIPAGSVSALFGAPVLIYLLVSQRHAAAD